MSLTQYQIESQTTYKGSWVCIWMTMAFHIVKEGLTKLASVKVLSDQFYYQKIYPTAYRENSQTKLT